MPTSFLRPSMLGSPMQVNQPPSYRPNDIFISELSMQATGSEMAAYVGTHGSVSYPASNRALGFMFCLGDPFLVRKVWWQNGTTASTNNADVGVYTEDGATLLVSAGSTAIAGSGLVQEVDVTDTLLPGRSRYWCVYNQNGTTATPVGSSLAAAVQRAIGFAQFAGAVPLGSSFTPAAIAGATFPHFGIAGRTQVA